MATMKRILIVGVLLASTVLGGYRVFAGGGSAVAALPADCAPQECQQQCVPCPPDAWCAQACTPDACGPRACTAVASSAQACTADAADMPVTLAACLNR